MNVGDKVRVWEWDALVAGKEGTVWMHEPSTYLSTQVKFGNGARFPFPEHALTIIEEVSP